MYPTLLVLCTLLFQTTHQNPDALFEIKRQGLRVTPERQTILLGETQAEFNVDFQLQYDGTLDENTRIRATLIGPDQNPHAIDLPANEMRIVLTPDLFGETGIYTLADIHLEHNGSVLEYAQPRNTVIQAVRDILISRVSVREISREELAKLGYVFNEQDYKVIQFDMAMVVGAVEVPITVPVAYPKKVTRNFQPIVLSDPFRGAISIKPMVELPNDRSGKEPLPISAVDAVSPSYGIVSLLLIPGQFSYWKTHLNVTCVALNTAPDSYDVRIDRLKATLHLPNPTKFGFPVTLGSGESLEKDVVHPGADGVLGNADDRNSILAGEEARVSYIVRGEQEGMYTVQVQVDGEVDLPTGKVKVKSVGTGNVLVRRPEFIVTMEHPETVAENEPYTMTMHFTNQGTLPLQGVSVTLDPFKLIGTELNGSSPTQSMADVPPGGEGSISYHLLSKVTGKVVANYFRIAGDIDGSLQLRVGVAETGERLTKYAVTLPARFYQEFSPSLAEDIRHYAKKLVDFSQMQAREMPVGIGKVESYSKSSMFQQFAMAAKLTQFGLSSQDALNQLFSAWIRSHNEAVNIDALRRYIQVQGSVNAEPEFGQAFAERFGALTDEALLRKLAQLNETAPGLYIALVESSSDPLIEVIDNLGRSSTNTGARGIPFCAFLPLSSTRTLIWCSGQEAPPKLRFAHRNGESSVVDVSTLMTTVGYERYLVPASSVQFDSSIELELLPEQGAMRYLQSGNPTDLIVGELVPLLNFELVAARQAGLDDGGDRYGRDVSFAFNRRLDLESITPLKQHLFINDLPVVDARIQSDNRFLIAGSRMPLGPYKPIRYRIVGARDIDGQELGEQTGIVTASPTLVGVSTHGRIVDPNGTDLSKATIFLWQRDINPKDYSGDRFGELTEMLENLRREEPNDAPWRIFHQVHPDADGNYEFDFVPWPPFTFKHDTSPEGKLLSFKIGILLPDGRYEERQYWPRGPGQDIPTDYSFSYLGTIQGQVTRQADSPNDPPIPVPFAPVYVVNQQFTDSAAITQTDEQGFYQVSGIEVGQILVKSRYGSYIGMTNDYLTLEKSPLTINLDINTPTAAVSGKVYYRHGEELQPIRDAFVGVLSDQVFEYFQNEMSYGIPHTTGARTLSDGSYQLTHVPARYNQLVIFHPSYGYATQQLTLVTDQELSDQDHVFDIIDFEGGSVAGRVIDMNGNPKAGFQVYLKNQSVISAADGSYHFNNVPLNLDFSLIAINASKTLYGSVGLSLTREVPNLSGIDITVHPRTLVTGRVLDSDGSPVPYVSINATGISKFFKFARTDALGYFQGKLDGELGSGQVAFAVINPPHLASLHQVVTESGPNYIAFNQRPQRDVHVHIRDAQGNPTVAAITIISEVPDLRIVNEGFPTDSQTTKFSNTDGWAYFSALNVGDAKIGAQSLLLGNIPLQDYQLIDGDGPVILELQFDQEILSNLFGTVYDIDGVTPAPAGTKVQAKVNGFTAVASVDANGRYAFETLVETSTQSVVNLIAYNPDHSYFTESTISLDQSLRFRHDMHLRGTGNLNISVIHADNTPAEDAIVRLLIPKLNIEVDEGVSRAIVSQTTVDEAISPTSQIARFVNIPSGPFTAIVLAGNGLSGMRSYAVPIDGGELDLTVRLEATSSISGLFANAQDQPIGNATIELFEKDDRLQQVLSSNLQDMVGRFSFTDLPMRKYTLIGTDPTSNLGARMTVQPTPFEPNIDVMLKLDPVADLEGIAYVDGVPEPGATIELIRGGFKLLTGTDDQGHYKFTNLRLGTYKLSATSLARTTSAHGCVTLKKTESTSTLDLNFEQTHSLDLLVLGPDSQPASRVLVYVNSDTYFNSRFTDDQGHVHFENLPRGRFSIKSSDPRSLALLAERIDINHSTPLALDETVTFQGFGSVQGFVRTSLGEMLNRSVTISFAWFDDTSNEITRYATTDGDGFYRIGRIPVDTRIKFRAYYPDTLQAASGEVTLSEHGEEQELNLTFKASTFVQGVVRYQDGSRAAFAKVTVKDPIMREVRADGLGEFLIQPVLEGLVNVSAEDLDSPRRALRTVPIAIDDDGVLRPIKDLVLTLGGIGNLIGNITLSDGTAISGTATLSSVNGQVSLEAPIFADGASTFGDVPFGSYRLTAYDRKLARTQTWDEFDISEDGVTLVKNFAFDPSFNLYGHVYDITGQPVVDGLVTLSIQKGNSFKRIYATDTDDQGNYLIEHVYPGLYSLNAVDKPLQNVLTENYIMLSADSSHDLNLGQTSSLVGTVATSELLPYSQGSVVLQQLGKLHSLHLAPNGTFSTDMLQPMPYTLHIKVAGGWIEKSFSGTLNAGGNTVYCDMGSAVSLTGTCIYQGSHQKQMQAWLYMGNKRRALKLNASGQFSINYVPANTPLKLALYHRSEKKIFTLPGYSSNTDLGTMELDGLGPALSFDAPGAGATVSSVPMLVQIGIQEPQSGSGINTGLTRVWANGSEISSLFTTTQTSVSANFEAFPAAFQHGANELTVKVYNTSGAYSTQTFAFNINYLGTQVVVELQRNGSPVTGQVKLVDTWQTTDANGRYVFNVNDGGSYNIKGKTSEYGGRDAIAVNGQLAIWRTLPMAAYASLSGTVYDSENVASADALIEAGKFWERSAADGSYLMDFLPLDLYRLIATKGTALAYREAPRLTIPLHQRLGVDLVLLDTGSVEGYVLDGSVGADNVDVTLEYQKIPRLTPHLEARTLQTDATGHYRFDGVYGYPISLKAVHRGNRRRGSRVLTTQANQVVQADISLEQIGDIFGTLLQPNGEPHANALVLAKTNFYSFSTVTDETGSFRFENLTQLNYDHNLYFSDATSDTWYKKRVKLGRDDIDLGTITTHPNADPYFNNLSYTNPVDPAHNLRLIFDARDDFSVKEVQVAFSGGYTQTFVYKTSGDKLAATRYFDLPNNTPQGPLDMAITIIDRLGHSTTRHEQLTVTWDQQGPNIGLAYPLPGAEFVEGTPIALQLVAQDTNGIGRVEIWQEDILRATKNGSSSSAATTFTFSFLAPGVDEDTPVSFMIFAYDTQGNLTQVPLDLIIGSKASSSAPVVDISTPLAGMPIPLSLPQGLVLPFKASVSDSDGLDRFEIRIEDVAVFGALLYGTSGTIDESFVIPEYLRGQESLKIEWSVWDLGGNETLVSNTLPAVEGNILAPGTAIAAYDLTLDNQTLILADGSFTIDGSHQFTHVLMVNGATLRQTGTNTSETYIASTQLNVSGDMVLMPGTLVDITGKGFRYLPAGGGGITSDGSYAAPGLNNTTASVYGSFLTPTLPGAHYGGGAFQVHAQHNIWHLGTILATPANTDPYKKGTGGSIWLTANQVLGDGRVNADGYHPNAYNFHLGYGSGGRIALAGDLSEFRGSVTTYGSDNSGAGTIYTSTPDPTMPDGRLDSVRIATNPDVVTTRVTQLPALRGQRVGTDVMRSSQPPREVLSFQSGIAVPPDRYLGLHASKPGEYAQSAPITLTTATTVATAPNQSFAPFTDGDTIDIDWDLDEIVVASGATFDMDGHQPRARIRLEGGTLRNGGSEEMDLTANLLSMSGKVGLIGNFKIGSVTTSADLSLVVDGRLTLPVLDHQVGTLIVDGEIVADEITVAAAAKVMNSTGKTDTYLKLTAPTMNIAGTVSATKNGRSQSSSGGFWLAHGGLGNNTTLKSSGSPYDPQSFGVSGSVYYEGQNAGGAIQLSFDQLALTGSLDASLSSGAGSGGSVRLQGTSLTGNGTIHANGSSMNGNYGAGGRIAFLVADITGYSGSAEALGVTSNNRDAGAGTIFYQTQEWPLGKLVIDNKHGGANTLQGITPLLGLGNRTAESATGGGPIIEGSDFPDSLAGLYVVVPGYDPVRIQSNTETQLLAAEGENFPALAAGASYSGLNILNVLEVKGHVTLTTLDPIRTGTLVTSDSDIVGPIELGELLSNQDLDLYTDPGFQNLTLENSKIRVHFPLNLESLTLGQGSSLTYSYPAQISGDVTIDGSSLIAAVDSQDSSFQAASVSMTNGATWTVADRMANGRAYPLVATISGTLSVDASSVISTSGSSKAPSVHVAWGSGTYGNDSHGGYGSAGSGTAIMGSYAFPSLPGTISGGGSIRLSAAELHLAGTIKADGSSTGSGGSIWLTAPIIQGTGLISAVGAPLKGGGRVAIYYGEDRSFVDTLDLITARSMTNTSTDDVCGAGTLFLKGVGDSFGELLLDQRGPTANNPDALNERFRFTGISGPGQIVMGLDDSNPDPLIIEDLSRANLPPGMAGIYARYSVAGTEYFSRVVNNTFRSITLADPGPALVPAGTTVSFELHLDRITLHDGGQLYFAGKIRTQEVKLEGSYLNGVHCANIEGLPQPLVLNNQKFRLLQTQPQSENWDLNLTDSILYLDQPVHVRDISLNNSTLRSADYEEGLSDLIPNFYLEARNIVALGSSGITAGRFDANGEDAHGSFGSLSSPGKEHDNLFHPRKPAGGQNGGGSIFVRADSIAGGTYKADALLRSAGSVYIEVGQISGDVVLSASDAHTTPLGGGGRIALYYDENTTTSLTYSTKGYYAGGTTYLRNRSESLGSLIIGTHRTTTGSNVGKITLPNFPVQTLGTNFTVTFDQALQQSTLTVPGLSLTNDYSDYHLIINGDKNRTHRIISTLNSGGAVFVAEGDLSDLSSGVTVGPALWFDQVSMPADTTPLPLTLPILEPHPPTLDGLTISPLSNGALQPGENFTVLVTASDNVRMKQVSVTMGAITASLDGVGPTYAFTLQAPVPESQLATTVDILLTDLFGQTTLHQEPILIDPVDTEDPVGSLSQPASGETVNSQAPFEAVFEVSDNRALLDMDISFNGVSLNHVFASSTQQTVKSFSLIAPYVSSPTDFPISFTIRDISGNSFTGSANISVVPETAIGFPRPSAYWTFDEIDRSNTTLIEVMHGLNGTLINGPLPGQPGKYAEAFSFDGVDDYVRVNTHPLLDETSTFTLSAWVNLTNYVEEAAIFTYGEDSAESYALVIHGDHATFQGNGSSTATGFQIHTGTLALGTWHHLVTSFNQGEIKIYLNGVLQESAVLGVTSLPLSSGRYFSIGLHQPGPNQHFKGLIDDLAVFSVVLDEAQILQLRDGDTIGGPLDLRPPEPPTNLTVVPLVRGLQFNWTASTNQAGDLAGYNIYFDGSSTPTLSVAPTTLSYTFEEIGSITEHEFTLRAFDTQGNEGDSVTLDAVTLPTPGDFPGPVSYWPFDSYKHEVDIMGRNYFSDFYEYAGSGYLGEGGAGWYNAGRKPSLSSRDQFTLSAWVKVSNFNNDGAIFFLGDNDHETYSLVTTSSKFFALRSNEPDTRYSLETTTTLSVSTWYYLTATFDSGVAKIYVNGRLAAEDTWPVQELAATNTPYFVVGRHDTGSDVRFSGLIDEAVVWDKTLNPAQIRLLYNVNKAGKSFRSDWLNFVPAPQVTGLKNTSYTDHIDYTWTPASSADLVGYRIYFDDLPFVELPATANAWTSPTLLPFTIHSFRIVSVDTDAIESASVEVTTSTLPEDLNQLPYPISYWSFDAATLSSGIFQDYMGINPMSSVIYGNPGGMVNQAAQLYNANNYLTPYARESLTHLDHLTVSTWAKMALTPDMENVFTLGTPDKESLSLTVVDASRLSLRSNHPDTRLSLDAVLDMNRDSWYHFVVTFSEGLARVYVNQTLVIEGQWPARLPAMGTPYFRFANNHAVDSSVSRVTFDETAIWDKALSPEHIALLYSSGNQGLSLPAQGLTATGNQVSQLVVYPSPTSAQFEWAIPGPTSPSGFKLYLDGMPIQTGLPAGTTSTLVEGLTPLTRYTAKVTALDTQGRESSGRWISFETPASAELTAVPRPDFYYTFDNANTDSLRVYDVRTGQFCPRHGASSGQVAPQNQGMLFNGSSDYLDVPKHPTMDHLQQGDYTFSAWVKPLSLPPVGTSDRVYALMRRRNTNLGFYYTYRGVFGINHDLNNSSFVSLSSQNSFDPGRFYFVTTTVSNSEGVARIFVNGVFEGEISFAPGTSSIDTTEPWFIGTMDPDTGKYFAHAVIDDLKVWSQALTPDEAVSLFQASFQGPADDVTPPDEVSGTAIERDSTSLTLTWSSSASPDLVSYRVYLNDSLLETLDAQVSSYRFDGLAPFSIHALRLSGIDASGNESPGFKARATTLPAVPETSVALPNPVAHWTLDNLQMASNNTLALDTISGFQATIVNPVQIGLNGQLGEGVGFSADTGRIDLPNNSTLENLQEGEYTLSAWYRADKNPSNTGNYTNHSLVAKNGYNIGLQFTASNQFAMIHHVGGSKIMAASQTSYYPGSWHHVVGVVSKIRGTVELFVDGHLVGNQSFAPGSAAYEFGTRPWRIGVSNSSTSYFYPAEGTLDQVKLWNLTLNTEQVGTLYNQGIGAPELPQVRELAVVASASSLNFSWVEPPPTPQLSGYRYSLDGGPWTDLATGTTQVLSDGLSSGTWHQFRIKSYSSNGDESGYQQIDAVTEGANPPVPLAYWNMNDAAISGSQMQDQAGLNHAALGSTATGASGIAQQATSLEGQFMTVAATPLLDLSNFTLYAWVKSQGFRADAPIIVKPLSSGTSPAAAYKLSLEQNILTATLSDGSNEVVLKASTPIEVNRWIQVAASFDGSTLRLYQDGSLVTSAPASLSLASTSNDLGLGGNPLVAAARFYGQLDELAVWNSSLSAADVNLLYHRNRHGQPMLAIQSDTTAPLIQSTSTDPVAPLLDDSDFSLTVVASDETALGWVEVTFAGQTYQDAAPPYVFNLHVPRLPSVNPMPLMIVAVDTSGNQTSLSQALEVDVDTSAPTIDILTPAQGADFDMMSLVNVSFSASDAHALQSLQLVFDGGAPIVISSPVNGQTETVTLTMPYLNSDSVKQLVITATDVYGMSASLTRDITVHHIGESSLMPSPFTYMTFDNRDMRGDVPVDLRGTAQVFYNKGNAGYTGKVGQALDFSGASPSCLYAENNPKFSGEAWTISVWVKADSFVHYSSFVEYADWLGTCVYRLCMRKYSSTNTVVQFWANGQYIESSSLSTNRWYHLTGAYNQSTMSLYLDGELVGTIPSSPMVVTPAPVMTLGVEQSGTELQWLNGQIDEFALWDSSLNASQVQLLYQLGANGKTLDFRAPDEVTHLVADSTSNSITLNWTESTNGDGDLAGYRIYLDDDTNFQAVPVGTTTYAYSALLPETIYRVRVVTVDQAGNESPGVETTAVTQNLGGYPLMPASPLASWSFDNNSVSGNSLVSRQGGVNGTINGALSGQQGLIGQSLYFDGINDWIELASTTAMNNLQKGNYTLSAWVYPENVPPKVYLGASSNDNGESYSILMKPGQHTGIRLMDSFRVQHFFNDGSGIYLNSKPILPKRFYHVVGLVDRDNGLLKLYVDGREVASRTFQPGKDGKDLGTNPWRVASVWPNASTFRWPWKGRIDEVAVWDRALTPLEIATYYQVTNKGIEPDTFQPEPITSLQVVPTATSLDLTWTASANSLGDLAGYKLRIDAQAWIYLDANATSYSFPGLTPETAYNVEIRAIDTQGVLSNAVSGQATTLSPPKRGTAPLVSGNQGEPTALTRWLTPAGDLEIRGEKVVVENLTLTGRVYLIGAQLTVKGSLKARSLHLAHGSLLTSERRNGQVFEPLVLRLAETVEIDPSSSINLDGLGWHETEHAHTSHGGIASGSELSQLYDAPLYPILPGGGAAGGGALYLEADHLALEGKISARGLGFSSGGSVQLNLRELSGQGHIDVSGGHEQDHHGGGGRVAVHAKAHLRFLGTIASSDGPECAGSVIFVDPNQTYPLVGNSWPLNPEAKPLALLPAYQLEAAAIEGYPSNQYGSLVALKSEVDLSAYAGFWLEHNGKYYHVTQVMATRSGHYLLQLDGQLQGTTLEGARFILPTQGPTTIQASPGAVLLPQLNP